MFNPAPTTFTSYGSSGDSGASRETDVTRELGIQAHMAGELFEYAKRLEAALLPVLRNTGPDGMEKNPAPEPPMVPLAAKIKSNNERISAALATINSILQRLEL